MYHVAKEGKKESEEKEKTSRKHEKLIAVDLIMRTLDENGRTHAQRKQTNKSIERTVPRTSSGYLSYAHFTGAYNCCN